MSLAARWSYVFIFVGALLLVTFQSSGALAQPVLNELSAASPGLSHSLIEVGSDSFVLTIHGSGFSPGSIARLGSTNVASTYIGANAVTAFIPASMLKTVMTYLVTVLDGGNTSNP